MSEKIRLGCPLRCGKTLKSNIEKIINDMPYHYYYDDLRYKNFIDELRKERQHALNCRDKAPHQDEIDILSALGYSNHQIHEMMKIKFQKTLEKTYFKKDLKK